MEDSCFIGKHYAEQFATGVFGSSQAGKVAEKLAEKDPAGIICQLLLVIHDLGRRLNLKNFGELR